MRTINQSDYRDELRKLGVNMLSGGGCNMGTRIDTDVSPAAAPYVEEYLGGMKFTHSGFNGWGKDEFGKYHANYSSAYHYVADKRVIRDGWSTEDGYCFKLPRTMIDELLIFLLLKQNEHVIYVPAKRAQGFVLGGFILILSGNEYVTFRKGLNYEGKEYPSPSLPDTERIGRTLRMQSDEYDLYWRSYEGRNASANRHFFSGKKIA